MCEAGKLLLFSHPLTFFISGLLHLHLPILCSVHIDFYNLQVSRCPLPGESKP